MFAQDADYASWQTTSLNETVLSVDTEYWRESCIHELFERQVQQTPEAAAAVYGDTCLSYDELNRRVRGCLERARFV